jgi:hypothetical protein
MEKRALKVFYSYSHEDELYRAALRTHLSLLLRQGEIEDWFDRMITPGTEWEDAIYTNLDRSDVVLLLVSPNFLNSEFCYGKELEKALELHFSNRSVVIPIIIRPCDWETASFAKLLALPKDGKAVSTWRNQDEAWKNIVQGIKLKIHKIKSQTMQTKVNPKLMRDYLKDEIKRVEIAYENKGYGLSTGYRDIDEALSGGLHAGEVVLILSNSPLIRTDLALNIINRISDKDNNLFSIHFSMKLSSEQITRRLLSICSGVPTSRILQGKLMDNDWEKLARGAGKNHNMKLLLDDPQTLSLRDVRNTLEANTDKNISVIVIDTIQQVEMGNKPDQIITGMKNLAKEFKLSIILTCGIKITGDENWSPPFQYNLGEWESAREEVNMIFVLLEGPEAKTGVQSHELRLVKNPYGPTCLIDLKYFPETCRYELGETSE